MSGAPAGMRLALSSVLLALASVTTLAIPASGSTGSCDGVWVVVDARAAGGSLTTRCAEGDPTSGLAALDRAGFSYAFTPRIVGFVCTIDRRPDPCNGAPADAYWSYWHAEAGGSWSYATAGAGSRDPAPGSVEGWRFGDGSMPPGTAPPANAPAPAPEPEPEPSPTDDSTPAPDGGTDGDEDADTGDDDRSPSSTAGDRGSDATVDTTRTDTGPTSGDGVATEAGATTTTDDGSTRSATGGGNGTVAPGETAPRAAADEGQDAAGGGPDREPPAVTTGERPDPPAAATTAADPSATPPPGARTGDGSGATGEGDTAPTDGGSVTLATQRETGPPTSSVGAVVAVGLLLGLGGLTWRQRARRAGARP